MERGYEKRKRPELPSEHHNANNRRVARDQRSYQTPQQLYRPPRTSDTPYIGAPRHASYDTPRPTDHRVDVSWQHDSGYERPMDPKEFKEQCRQAYLQAAEERKRNAEMSVWGKCDWAVFEKCDAPYYRRL